MHTGKNNSHAPIILISKTSASFFMACIGPEIPLYGIRVSKNGDTGATNSPIFMPKTVLRFVLNAIRALKKWI